MTDVINPKVLLRSPFAPEELQPAETSPWLDRGIVVVLLIVVAVITGWGLGRYPSLSGDEGIYTEQAQAVVHGALAPYTYTYDHPFLGWAQLSAFAWVAQQLHVGGQLSVVNARFVMLVLQLFNAGLIYGIARRLQMHRVFSVAAVLLFALSPLTLTYDRAVFLDNIAVPWLLLSMFLALNPRCNAWAYGLAGTTFAVAVLSKETALLFAPALVFLLWQRTVHHVRLVAATLAAMMFGMIIVIYPAFALLRSELWPGPGHVSLWGNGIWYQLASRVGSGSVFRAQDGKNNLFMFWEHTDGVLLLGGMVACVALLASTRLRFLSVALLAAALPVLSPGGYLPAMYVIALLPFAALAIAGVAGQGYALADQKLARSVGRARWLLPVPYGLVALAVGVAYAPGVAVATASDPVKPYADARAFMATHLGAADTVLTDDAFFVDLNRQGLSDPWHQAVSYYKYDLDPRARLELPGGYGNLTYIIETPQMRSETERVGAATALPHTLDAIRHSYVLAHFGGGDDTRVEIRRMGVAPAPPALLTPGQVSAAEAQGQLNALTRQFGLAVDVTERTRLLARIEALKAVPGTTMVIPGVTTP